MINHISERYFIHCRTSILLPTPFAFELPRRHYRRGQVDELRTYFNLHSLFLM